MKKTTPREANFVLKLLSFRSRKSFLEYKKENNLMKTITWNYVQNLKKEITPYRRKKLKEMVLNA